MGYKAIRLHYSADPEKNPFSPDENIAKKAQEWLDTHRARWPDPNDFEREFEINWHVGIGSRVFPQFNETNHTKGLGYNKRRTLYRGWDFGWHAPVALFAQIDEKDRLVLLKELVGSKRTTSDFAQDVIKKTAEWFPNHVPGFDDFCDPAGQHQKSIESEKSERRDTEVLNGLGIYPRWEYGWSRKDGRSLVHQLLALRSDDTPGLWVDKSGCPMLTQAFLGRYVYPEVKSADVKIKEEPDDETHPWADLMASLRYLVIGVHRKLALRRFQLGQETQTAPPSRQQYHGYGTPIRETV